VLDAYHKNDGNISKTAQALHVSRNTVYRELRRAGIVAD
jgi:transcriptional regulator of acetoin/glycerol metabolism